MDFKHNKRARDDQVSEDEEEAIRHTDCKASDVLVLRQQVTAEAERRNIPELCVASEAGHVPVVEALLQEAGVDVNAAGDNSRVPLHCACDKGHLEVVALLLKDGRVNVNAQDTNRSTPLMFASWKGFDAIVGLLLQEPTINVEVADPIGQTALHLAASSNYPSTMDLLLRVGHANINAKNTFGCTPFDLAFDLGVRTLLLLHGAVPATTPPSAAELAAQAQALAWLDAWRQQAPATVIATTGMATDLARVVAAYAQPSWWEVVQGASGLE
jgi:hypothetical protein